MTSIVFRVIYLFQHYGRLSDPGLCKPRYGRCVKGTRFVPVQMLDVAGLVPGLNDKSHCCDCDRRRLITVFTGASEGKGLGNQFLDDLRHADVLLHIIDVSGTTNEKVSTILVLECFNSSIF